VLPKDKELFGKRLTFMLRRTAQRKFLRKVVEGH